MVVVAPRPESTKNDKSALDDVKPEFGDGTRRRSAFGLAQEPASPIRLLGAACLILGVVLIRW